MESVIQKIRTNYSEMGPAEKKIADFVTGNINDIMATSISELAELCGNYSCDRGSHLGTNGNHSSASVGKVIGLLGGDLLAALCGVELERLKHRAVIFFKCRKLKRLADLSEKPVAKAHIVGVKVTCPLIGLC